MKQIGKIILLLAFTLRAPQGQAQAIAPVTQDFRKHVRILIGKLLNSPKLTLKLLIRCKPRRVSSPTEF